MRFDLQVALSWLAGQIRPHADRVASNSESPDTREMSNDDVWLDRYLFDREARADTREQLDFLEQT
jgi:hypothetical protein